MEVHTSAELKSPSPARLTSLQKANCRFLILHPGYRCVKQGESRPQINTDWRMGIWPLLKIGITLYNKKVLCVALAQQPMEPKEQMKVFTGT